METIKNYLESMFANMPNTEAVRKAKDELLQMMEDKYNELISEGESENAAIGTVISEFGNLDELAENLGVSTELSEVNMELANVSYRQLAGDEVKDYITATYHMALQVAIGVMLCIMCVSGPITATILHVNPGWGVGVMFIMIGVAVGLFVYSGITFSKWKYVKEEACRIDMQTAKSVDEELNSYHKTYALWLTLGVVLCALCWLPAAVLGAISAYLADIGAALLFVMVGVGVFLIVYSSNVKKGYEIVLGLNDPSRVSGNYVKGQEEIAWMSDGARLFMEIYWPMITCIYLCWSFLTFKWYMTWIIWPIAKLIQVILKAALRKR